MISVHWYLRSLLLTRPYLSPKVKDDIIVLEPNLVISDLFLYQNDEHFIVLSVLESHREYN